MSKSSQHSKQVSGQDPACAAIRPQLLRYVTDTALGLHADNPELMVHINACAACRTLLEELQDLTTLAYSEQVIPDPNRSSAGGASFLEQTKPSGNTQRPWRFDELGRLIVWFSTALQPRTPRAAWLGVTRGQLLYAYTQDVYEEDTFKVTIEIYRDVQNPALCRVRIKVKRPSAGPLDQAGTGVIMRIGGETWSSQTDGTGYVDFTGVSPETITGLRVEITPPNLRARLNAGQQGEEAQTSGGDEETQRQ
ncbi:MAG: hypothetical protein MI924_11715 [Chloroflexales bacterium]|nr:hypothetical protein [Chloroflexales bacterium]